VRLAAAVAAVIVIGGAAEASAQTTASYGRVGRWEIGGGPVFAPGYDLGSQEAELTRNGDASLGPFDLFSSETSMDGAVGLQARLGLYLNPRISVEGGVRYARPTVATRLTDDTENADDTTATEQLSQFVFDGAVVFHFLNLRFYDGRGTPFVSGGAGYIRELHEGNELIETGNAINATGGVKLWFGTGGRRLGMRAEAGISSRSGGFDFEDGRRIVPLVSASLVYLF
jgi:hypothetical protein